MKKSIALAVLAVLCAINCFNATAQDNDPNMGIIQAPVSIKRSAGEFELGWQTYLVADSANNKAVVFFTDYLHQVLRINKLKKQAAKSVSNTIVLTSKGTGNLPAQGYRLTITPKSITVAGKGAGLFYGIQTLIQLFPANRLPSLNFPVWK